jgi:putative oxidoreductase
MLGALAVARILCGAAVLACGLLLLGAFGWEPPVAPPHARAFQVAMHDAGYFLPIITAVFLVTGVSFIFDRYAALAALVLLPISVNMLLYHAVLGGGQLPVALLFFGVNCYVLWYCRAAYGPLLRAKA